MSPTTTSNDTASCEILHIPRHQEQVPKDEHISNNQIEASLAEDLEVESQVARRSFHSPSMGCKRAKECCREGVNHAMSDGHRNDSSGHLYDLQRFLEDMMLRVGRLYISFV